MNGRLSLFLSVSGSGILAVSLRLTASDQKKGRLGQAPERRKESFEWETLSTLIGAICGNLKPQFAKMPTRNLRESSRPLFLSRPRTPTDTASKKPRRSGA